jgi:prophage tail gpP-like protein
VPDFEIFINGGRYSQISRGWVTRQLESAADEFQFTYADLRIDLGEPFPIEAGDACEIYLQSKLMLTGYVDDISIEYQADSLTLTARGRSKAGDLVDSSAVYKTSRLDGKKLRDIVSSLCAPYRVPVEIQSVPDVDVPFRRFAIDPGESVFDVIQRAAKLRGLWPVSKPDGTLHLIRASEGKTATVSLEYGKNIAQGGRYDSWAQRHSVYFLKGQVPGDGPLTKQAAAEIADIVVDDAINRYRPLLVVSTGHDRKGDLKRRAQWERNRRAGTGERLQYRVDGFGYDGELWEPNTLVHVLDPRLRVDDTLLTASVSYRWQAADDDAGRLTDLILTRKEAFMLQDYPSSKLRPPPPPPRDYGFYLGGHGFVSSKPPTPNTVLGPYHEALGGGAYDPHTPYGFKGGK